MPARLCLRDQKQQRSEHRPLKSGGQGHSCPLRLPRAVCKLPWGRGVGAGGPLLCQELELTKITTAHRLGPPLASLQQTAKWLHPPDPAGVTVVRVGKRPLLLLRCHPSRIFSTHFATSKYNLRRLLPDIQCKTLAVNNTAFFTFLTTPGHSFTCPYCGAQWAAGHRTPFQNRQQKARIQEKIYCFLVSVPRVKVPCLTTALPRPPPPTPPLRLCVSVLPHLSSFGGGESFSQHRHRSLFPCSHFKVNTASVYSPGA